MKKVITNSSLVLENSKGQKVTYHPFVFLHQVRDMIKNINIDIKNPTKLNYSQLKKYDQKVVESVFDILSEYKIDEVKKVSDPIKELNSLGIDDDYDLIHEKKFAKAVKILAGFYKK
ncbi:hypothetical protein ACFL1H_07815 [Nanoarchaeota archaeon]